MPRAIFAKQIVLSLIVSAALILSLPSADAVAQGETTSAIVGQVRDASGGGVPGATVTIHNLEEVFLP